jgi:DNA-binding transcriptional LysR family regulator
MFLAAPNVQRYLLPMELRHLRYFLAVADTLNFSRAAERLRVAQPALSRQIQALEDELGIKLFERSTTKVDLTEAGRFLRHHGVKLLEQLDDAVNGAKRVANGEKESLKIGTGWNSSQLLIADAARELHEVSPLLAIDFVEMPSHRHLQALRSRQLDLGFVSGNMLTPRKDIDYRLIYRCGLKAILPKAHPLAGNKKVRLRDLKQERWIAIDEKERPGFKVLMAQILRPAQFAPKFGRSAQSFPGMLAFVGTGEGIALLPEVFLPPEPDGLRYVETDCAPYEMYAVWLKGRANAHVTGYLDILRRKISEVQLARSPSTLSRAVPAKKAAKTRSR